MLDQETAVNQALIAAGVVGGLGEKRKALAKKIVEEGDADRVDLDAAEMLRDEARRQGTRAVGVWVLSVLESPEERRGYLQMLQSERARKIHKEPSQESEYGVSDRNHDVSRRDDRTAEEIQWHNDRKAFSLFRGDRKTPQQIAELMGEPVPVTVARIRRIIEIEKPDTYEPLSKAASKRGDKAVASEVARKESAERAQHQYTKLNERLDREASP